MLIIIFWICIFATGSWLRFDDLGKRPFHADEATGASITCRQLLSGQIAFNPEHYHGPLLSTLAVPICKWRGEHSWPTLTKYTLRLVPAIAGTLLLCIPLLGRKRFGDPAMLLAAALLATSPLLTYYSRMFIHEMILCTLGLAVPFFFYPKSRWFIASTLIALMFATKETFVISLLAWFGAGLMLLVHHRVSLQNGWHYFKLSRITLICALLFSIPTAFYLYTNGFSNAQGAIESIRTFFVYKTVSGHGKPFDYYFSILCWPHYEAGRYWGETSILLLAVYAYISSFRRNHLGTASRIAIRFFWYAAIGHFAIYSLIAYKTPWLVCLAWAHMIIAAGFALPLCFKLPHRSLRYASFSLIAAALFFQFKLTLFATRTLSSDSRNPYTCVPTRSDVEHLESWLQKLIQACPPHSFPNIAIVGQEYWPLPWYLRAFPHIDFLPKPSESMEARPLIIAMPDYIATLEASLEQTHSSARRYLRPNFPIQVFVRNDLWNQWMNPSNP